MVARTMSFHLKPGLSGEFRRLLDQDILPMFRNHEGFQDQMTLVAANRAEAIDITLWHRLEDAEAFARDAHSAVVKALEHVVQGTPLVQTYEVSSSTLHLVPVPVPVSVPVAVPVLVRAV
jgi:hypothetical protein